MREYPTFDEDSGQGILAGAGEDDDEEFEIDLNDTEPEFLKGNSTKSGIEMSPIKIVKNPDGSLQRAAMTQVRTGTCAERMRYSGFCARGVRNRLRCMALGTRELCAEWTYITTTAPCAAAQHHLPVLFVAVHTSAAL